MKRIIACLLLASFLTLSACSTNPNDSNYENTNPDNAMERVYEEEVDNPSFTAE